MLELAASSSSEIVALPATLNNFSNCAQRRNNLPHNRKFAAKYFCELYVTVNAIWSCFLGWFVKINDINFAKLFVYLRSNDGVVVGERRDL